MSGTSSDDGLVVALMDGHVTMVYSHILSQMGTSNHTYNDGELHTFQMTFEDGQIMFVIDGSDQLRLTGVFGKGSKQLNEHGHQPNASM